MCKLRVAAFAIVVIELTTAAYGQYKGQQVYQKRQSYSDYYKQQTQSLGVPNVNVRNYTIDTYFYHRPTLSPYLNLTRRTGPNNLNNYYRFVVPEVDRRSKMPNNLGLTTPAPSSMLTPPASPNHSAMTNPTAMPMSNPYFNKYYNFGGMPPSPAAKPAVPPLPKLYP